MYIEKLKDKDIIKFINYLEKKYSFQARIGYNELEKHYSINRKIEKKDLIYVHIAKYENEYGFDCSFGIDFHDFDLNSLSISSEYVKYVKDEILLDYRAFMYNKFGKDYITSLHEHLRKEKNEKIGKFTKQVNEKYEKDLKELDLFINKNKSKDIYEEILKNFQKDLDRFETIEEKIEYLKSLGFDVKSKKDEENIKH